MGRGPADHDDLRDKGGDRDQLSRRPSRMGGPWGGNWAALRNDEMLDPMEFPCQCFSRVLAPHRDRGRLMRRCLPVCCALLVFNTLMVSPSVAQWLPDGVRVTEAGRSGDTNLVARDGGGGVYIA